MSDGSGGGLPWWDRLPDDFYRQKDGTELDAKHPCKIGVTAALDRATRTGLGSLIAAASAPSVLSRRQMRAERNLMGYYRDLATRGNADEVFVRPQSGVEIQAHDQPPRGFGAYRPAGIPAQWLSFTGGYKPRHPGLAKSHVPDPRNQQAWAQHWTHADGPRPTLIFVHGVLLDSYRINSRFFSLPWFHRRGYDVLLVTLPFHGWRGSPLLPSGFGFFSHGLIQVNENMLQAIHDLRVWIDYLQARGAPSIGISGLSLGGYLSATLTSVDDRLAFCIPNSPVVTTTDMCMEWLPIRWLMRATMERQGISLRELRHGMALHSPLTYAPKISSDRLMIIGGAADRFTPPRFVRLLHDHWPGSPLHWFPGNHIIHLQQGKYLRLMKAFMDRHCQLA